MLPLDTLSRRYKRVVDGFKATPNAESIPLVLLLYCTVVAAGRTLWYRRMGTVESFWAGLVFDFAYWLAVAAGGMGIVSLLHSSVAVGVGSSC